MKKSRKSWERLTRILGWKGVNLILSGIFFKEIVQAMLIFGSETWVMTPYMERALRKFQHRVALRITGRHPRRREEEGWDYPPLKTHYGRGGI